MSNYSCFEALIFKTYAFHIQVIVMRCTQCLPQIFWYHDNIEYDYSLNNVPYLLSSLCSYTNNGPFLR